MMAALVLLRLWASVPSHDLAWAAAKARYNALSMAESQSCVELVRLAVAGCAGGLDCDPREYEPAVCGGKVRR